MYVSVLFRLFSYLLIVITVLDDCFNTIITIQLYVGEEMYLYQPYLTTKFPSLLLVDFLDVFDIFDTGERTCSRETGADVPLDWVKSWNDVIVRSTGNGSLSVSGELRSFSSMSELLRSSSESSGKAP